MYGLVSDCPYRPPPLNGSPSETELRIDEAKHPVARTQSPCANACSPMIHKRRLSSMRAATIEPFSFKSCNCESSLDAGTLARITLARSTSIATPA